MRTSQDLASAFMARLKNAMALKAPQEKPVEPVARNAELIPGEKFSNERGRMVTVMRVSHLRVMYRYEGYQDICETSRREFDLKFRKVQS